jgi:hypothetical protein
LTNLDGLRGSEGQKAARQVQAVEIGKEMKKKRARSPA